jgi:hypothetical protein
MYKPLVLISPTEAEKLLKADYAEVAPFVTQSDGALSLAPESDKRPAVDVNNLQFGDLS